MKLHNLAFIDVETTGFSPEKHEIIELAVVLAKQTPREGKGPKLEIIQEKEWKIKPEHLETAEEQALRVNGYNEVDWMFAVDLKNAMEEFAKLIAKECMRVCIEENPDPRDSVELQCANRIKNYFPYSNYLLYMRIFFRIDDITCIYVN